MKTLVLAFVLLLALVPAPAQAAVDTWKVLHVLLETDTDGDGVANRWPNANVRKWRADIACFEPTLEAWSGGQIDVATGTDRVRVPSNLNIPADPNGWMVKLHDQGYAARWPNYDVILVWFGYQQPIGADAQTWNIPERGYAVIGLNGLTGYCPAPGMDAGANWPVFVPPHEFVHTVTGLYASVGFPVCPTYDYNYWQFGEWDGHRRILTNSFPPTTCSDGPWAGQPSTGVPTAAWASGSWTEWFP